MILNSIKQKILPKYKKRDWPGLINAYKSYLPVTPKTPIITLKEGNTPLIFSENLSNLIGNDTKVYQHYELIRQRHERRHGDRFYHGAVFRKN